MPNSVLVERRERVMVITIDRPQVRNAVNAAVSSGLGRALVELDTDDSISVAVVTGAGGTFCAGRDLKESANGRPAFEGPTFRDILRNPPRKPLIAAVEGFAVGGGLELTLIADLVVVGESAQLGIPEARRGLVASGGGLLRLPRRVNERLALELALTGEFLSGSDAFRLGLANRVVPDGQALDAALELAGKVAKMAPLSVAASKRVIVESRNWPVDEMFERQAEITDEVLSSTDAREGAQAFTDKRDPVWQGT